MTVPVYVLSIICLYDISLDIDQHILCYYM